MKREVKTNLQKQQRLIEFKKKMHKVLHEENSIILKADQAGIDDPQLLGEYALDC